MFKLKLWGHWLIIEIIVELENQFTKSVGLCLNKKHFVV